MTDTDQYDPQVADVYIHHLAEVSEKNEVIAREDIVSEFGVLLVAKGVAIGKKTARLLSNHRLSKPVDDFVKLSKPLSNSSLLNEFEETFQSSSDLNSIYDENRASELLRHLFLSRNFPHPLLQKLAVLKEKYPTVYQRSLFGALFGSLIAREMGWSTEGVHDVFVASIFQDLGMLHIPEGVVLKEAGFDKDQWRAMQSHVVVSSIIVESLGFYSDSVHSGIREHHERPDGLGYPKRLTENKLGSTGKIIALSDLIYRIRGRSSESDNSVSIESSMPYLRMNNRPVNQTIHAAIKLIKRGEISRIHAHTNSDIQQLAKIIVSRGDAIYNIYLKNLCLLSLLNNLVLEKTGLAMKNLVELADYTFVTTGFDFENIYEEIGSFTYSELKDIDETQIEYLWIIKRIQQSSVFFIENSVDRTLPISGFIVGRLERIFSLLAKQSMKVFEPSYSID